jgi:phenylpropionate dioxygenase-like ring-hydroxylating dioxygenase large terminal subunit
MQQRSTLIQLRTHEPRTRPGLAHKARQVGMNPNHWYPAAFSRELKRRQIIEARFAGEDLAVFRGDDGVAQVVENRCPHRHIKLSHGSVENCNLVCLYHGWTFDRQGELIGTKHDDFGKKLPSARIRSYPTQERYDIIWFFPGDPALAQVTPLVEIPNYEGPGAWGSLSFAYTWAAHHSMVIDNLCNLTHLWVHGRWIPYGDTILAEHTLEGDKITLTWQHQLRRDYQYPLTRRLFGKNGGPESETYMVYDYPYQSALSNNRVRSNNFLLPIDDTHTKVFSLQQWRPARVPFTENRYLPTFAAQAFMPLLRPYVMEVFRQDGFTVEEEQAAYLRYADKPIPEPNPAVHRFNKLAVRKWNDYLAYSESGGLSDAQRAEQTRVKRM